MANATIILPNFNNERILPTTFEYLRRNIDCSQVAFVMVDDGSEDQSLRVAKEEIPKCGFAEYELIERAHEGIVPALNTAYMAAKTEMIIRIDGDATVETPNWVNRLLATLQHDEVGLVGGQVVWETGTVHTLGRSLFSEYGLYDMGCCPLEPAGQRTFDSIVYRPKHTLRGGAPYEVDTLLGVCAAFRKSDAMAVGGFDMRFNPVWIEDDDFGVRLRSLGKRIIIDPEIKIIHRPSLRGSRTPGSRGVIKSNATRKSTKTILRQIYRQTRQTLSNYLKGNKTPQSTPTYRIPQETNQWRRDILLLHYQKWHEKWGFDPINPDMDAIYNRYWDTPLCWRANPAQLAQSREFIASIQP